MRQEELFNSQLTTQNSQQLNQPVECLGLTFPNDEERRKYFLEKLREGLEELHAKLGGVPFTTVEDAVERMKSVEKWPMPACRDARGAGRGDETRLRALYRTSGACLEPTPESATVGDWGSVCGELLTFDDPKTRLPAIDRLEGFHPNGPSLYRRVLVPVCISGQALSAWMYVGDPDGRGWKLLVGGI